MEPKFKLNFFSFSEKKPRNDTSIIFFSNTGCGVPHGQLETGIVLSEYWKFDEEGVWLGETEPFDTLEKLTDDYRLVFFIEETGYMLDDNIVWASMDELFNLNYGINK